MAALTYAHWCSMLEPDTSTVGTAAAPPETLSATASASPELQQCSDPGAAAIASGKQAEEFDTDEDHFSEVGAPQDTEVCSTCIAPLHDCHLLLQMHKREIKRLAA